MVGSFGIGCFSLYATKNLQCGEGGLVTTSDDGSPTGCGCCATRACAQRYRYELAGHNWRLTDLQAAIAVPQLARLARTSDARAANAARLSAGLAGLPGLLLPERSPDGRHVWHQYTVRVTADAPLTREALTKHLAAAGIGSGLYYPALMYDYECYAGHPQIVVDPTPVAARVTGEVLSLPVHQHLSAPTWSRIVATVRQAFHG